MTEPLMTNNEAYLRRIEELRKESSDKCLTKEGVELFRAQGAVKAIDYILELPENIRLESEASKGEVDTNAY